MDRNSRERIVKTTGGVIIAIILYAALFLLPTLESVGREKDRHKINMQNFAELRKDLEEYSKYKGDTEKVFEGSLSALVEQKAREAGVTISYIKPYGERGGELEIKVDEMPGKKILEFAYDVEAQGARISSLNMRDYKGTGIWVVKMNLLAGGESEQP